MNKGFKFAVIGHPIQHSKSPDIHHQFARQLGLDVQYDKIDLPPDAFNDGIAQLWQQGYQGLNITVPHKLAAYELADELSPLALSAGAVNTLMPINETTILGTNTDGLGLVSDIQTRLATPLVDKRILILGAGGAVRGILDPFLQQQPHTLVIANRTASKAEDLIQSFQQHALTQLCGCGFTDIEPYPFDIVINGTAASLDGQLPNIPIDTIDAETLVVDMMYSAHATVFNQWAAQYTQQLSDGLGMLTWQAAYAFELWTGQLPDVPPVYDIMRRSLGQSLT